MDVMEIVGRYRVVQEVAALACDGHTVLVFGPLGIGKTAILTGATRFLRGRGMPFGLSGRTETFRDLVQGLEEMYPGLEAHGRGHRQIRNRLRLEAESRPGVLVLDHLGSIGTAARGLLRYVRGLGLGILIGADVEHPRDHAWLRGLRLSHREYRVPPLPRRDLRRVLDAALRGVRMLQPLGEEDASAMVDKAMGRPGWIVRMASRLEQARYWSHGRLLVNLLAIDVSVETKERYLRPV